MFPSWWLSVALRTLWKIRYAEAHSTGGERQATS
jgi:hypothetical protein